MLATLLLAGVLASAAYVFTASNTVPASRAGSGASAISGYTVSNVVYNLNASDPSNIDSLSFSLSPVAAGTVKVQLASGGTWYTCTHNSTTGVSSCPTTSPQATVSGATQLAVVSVE
jgi:hypothetical protein